VFCRANESVSSSSSGLAGLLHRSGLRAPKGINQLGIDLRHGDATIAPDPFSKIDYRFGENG
jgi:hypothetical protein